MAGSWKLEAGCWRLEAGRPEAARCLRLEDGGWRLGAERRRLDAGG